MQDKTTKEPGIKSHNRKTYLENSYASNERKTGSEEERIVQLIVFRLGNQEYAANIDQVREILLLGQVTPIPDSPGFIAGVTNVRGEIALVIDLKKRFFLKIKEDVQEKHIVMTEQEHNLFGLMVDEVTEVLRIAEGTVKPILPLEVT